MKHLKKYNEHVNEATSYIKQNEDDEYEITQVTQDDGHEYKFCDGIMYELSTSGQDVVAYVSEIEHTEENMFYENQIDSYVEYIEDGGILETFPVDASPLGGAYNLESMCEFLGESENFDLMYDILHKDHEELFDIVENLSWDADSYGIDGDILSNIRNEKDLEKYYGDDYNEEYSDEDYINDDGTLFWKEEYYLGFQAILEHWKDAEEYTLTDMNHRFAAIKRLGKTMVYVDPS